jgi:hypothetical protein
MEEGTMMTYFSVLSRHSPGVAEENHKTVNENNRYQLKLNLAYPDSESGALPL